MIIKKEQAELLLKLQNAETSPIELQGIRPSITPEMQTHLDAFKSWYDQEYGDGECPGVFVANFDSPELITTGNQLQTLLDEANEKGLTGV